MLPAFLPCDSSRHIVDSARTIRFRWRESRCACFLISRMEFCFNKTTVARIIMMMTPGVSESLEGKISSYLDLFFVTIIYIVSRPSAKSHM